MKPPIPIPVLKNLRCGHCRKFVTCGPVHVTPDSSILCGRCQRYAKQSYRNIAFEAIASIYRYPCYYWPKHCNKRLVWNESLDHETKCMFQSSCNVFCSRPGTFFSSDRKLPNTTEINLEHITDDIISQLQCAVCESYLSNSPVYLMVDGKNICHRCTHANGVPKGAVRNLAYETIATSVIFPCIYRFRGCAIRSKFGRQMWGHETDCPYGQMYNKNAKRTSKVIKDGKEKERGVIQTHSGHVWGTITPHSALFSPPKTKNDDGKMVTQELEEKMKRKLQEEVRGFDAQSLDSVVSKASTFDSLADNTSRDNVSRDNVSRDNVSRDNVSRDNVSRDNVSRDNVSRSTIDNISRTTADNVSRDNISRSTVDNISRDNVSRSSSRMPPQDDYRPNDPVLADDYRPSISGYPGDYPGVSSFHEVAPLPTPPGYKKVPHNGYYQDNVARYGRPSHLEHNPHLFHYPPVYYDNNSNVNYSASFSYAPTHSQIVPKRSESFRVGNQEIIDELKLRQNRKPKDENPYNQCNNLQDLVQRHDEVFN